MSICVVLGKVERIVGCDVFNAVFFGIFQELKVDMILLVQPMSVELEVEIVTKVFVPPF